MTSDLLTAIIPSRNRPHNLAGQLRLFETYEAPCAVIVADSSDADEAARVRAARGRAQYQAYAPEMTLFDKLAKVVATVETPFVLLAADRKITFPHAVDAALAHLLQHEDHVAAAGYVIGFGAREEDIDINRVIFFTPTIGEDDALQRQYHLMRRYQPWQFSVFRIAPLATALKQAMSVAGAVFQEVMFMNAMALQGKMARLPNILSLQTTERSFHPLRRNDPVYWFLDDSRSFFRHYLYYRNSLARFISDRGIPTPAGTELHQLLDTVHAVWLHYNFNGGVLNYATRLLLGEPLPPLPHPRPPVAWREVAHDDVVQVGCGQRRYVWRREVLNAEPKDEISISSGEMGRIGRQLDSYFGD